MGRPWWQKALWVGTGVAAGAASLYVMLYGTPSAPAAEGIKATTDKLEPLHEENVHTGQQENLQQTVSCEGPELQGAVSVSPAPPSTPSVTQHAPRSHAFRVAGEQAKRSDTSSKDSRSGQQCIAELPAAGASLATTENSTAKPAAMHMAGDGTSAPCDAGSIWSRVTASDPSGGLPCSVCHQGPDETPPARPPHVSTQAAGAAQVQSPPVHVTAAATAGSSKKNSSRHEVGQQQRLQAYPEQEQPQQQQQNWQKQKQLTQGLRESVEPAKSAPQQQQQQAPGHLAAAQQQESCTQPHSDHQAQPLPAFSQPSTPLHSPQQHHGVARAVQQLQQQPSQQWPMLQPVRSGVHAPNGAQHADVQAVAEGRPHRSFNTARHAPSLDATVASAAVTRSLVAQYDISTAGSSTAPLHSQLQGSETVGGCNTAAASGNDAITVSQPTAQALDEHTGQGVSTLAANCAALCVQHCVTIQDAVGRETTVLDIGCGTGGTCFELAASFGHVLGIDGDVLNITAAKELKSHGELCFSHTSSNAGSRYAAAHQQPQQEASQAAEEQQSVCIARVPSYIDRDRVRFWHCPLPQLPPKLQPVDAVLVEDVDGHLGSGLQRVCQQLPALLNPEGVCVVVLGAAAHEQADHASLEKVRSWLDEAGLLFQQEVALQFKSGSSQQVAQAGVWLQPAC